MDMKVSAFLLTEREQGLWAMCVDKSHGNADLFNASTTWPEFDRAWRAWSKAMATWVDRQRPTLGEFVVLYKGAIANQSELGMETLRLRQAIFLEGYQHQIKCRREWLQAHACEIGAAARAGDLEFFNKMANAAQQNGDSRDFGFQVLQYWMERALWACKWDAAAQCLQHFFPRDNPPSDPGETLRKRCGQLKLWHNPKSHIVGWSSDWKAVISLPAREGGKS